MKLFKYLPVLIFSFLFLPLAAKIIECKKYADLKKHAIAKNCLFLTDLDNTVWLPEEEQANDQCVSAAFKKAGELGFKEGQILEYILPRYWNMLKETQMLFVESTTKSVIGYLQQKQIPICAFTARSMPILPATFRQLDRLGLDFSKTTKQFGDFIDFKGLPYPARFIEGIISCEQNDKGSVLRAFLKSMRKSNYKPSLIIFIDDKKSALDSVEKVCKKMKIDFIGLRYGFLDSKYTLNEKSIKWLEGTCYQILHSAI